MALSDITKRIQSGPGSGGIIIPQSGGIVAPNDNVYQNIFENTITNILQGVESILGNSLTVMTAIHAEAYRIPTHLENIEIQLGILLTYLHDDLKEILSNVSMVTKDNLRSEEKEREDSQYKDKQLSLLDKILGVLGSTKDSMVKSAKSGMGGIWGAILGIPIIGTLAATIAGWFTMATSAVVKIYNTTVAAVTLIYKAIKQVIRAIAGTARLIGRIISETSKLLIGIGKAIYKQSVRLFTWIKTTGVFAWISTRMQTLADMMTKQYHRLISNIKSMSIWKQVSSGITRLKRILYADYLRLIKDLRIQNPLAVLSELIKTMSVKIRTTVGASLARFTNWWKGSKLLASIFGSSGIIAGAITKLKNIFGGKSGILTRLSSFFGKIGSSPVLKVLSPILKVVGKLFLPLTVILGAFTAIKSAIEGYKTDGILGAITGFFGGILEFLTFGLFKAEWLTDFVKWIGEKARIAGENIGNAVGYIWHYAKTAVTSIIDFIRSIPEFAYNLITRIFDVVTTAVTSIIDFIKSIPEFAYNLITRIFDTIASYTSKMTEMVWDGVKNYIHRVINTLKNIFDGIVEWVTGIIPDAVKDKVELAKDGAGVIQDSTKIVTDGWSVTEVVAGRKQENPKYFTEDNDEFLARQRRIKAKRKQEEATTQQVFNINAPSSTTNNTSTGGGGSGTVFSPSSTRQNDTSFQRQQDSNMAPAF